jgi:hypothetical protein
MHRRFARVQRHGSIPGGARWRSATKRIVAPHGPPDLCPTHEQPLFAGEAVDDRCRLAAKRISVSFEPEQDTAKVADILAHGYPAADGHSGQGGEGVGPVLCAQLRRLSLELGGLRRSPPIAEDPATVRFAPLVVEPVTDSITQSHRRWRRNLPPGRHQAEKRELEDCGRKDDLVPHWQVIGVDRFARRVRSAPCQIVDWRYVKSWSWAGTPGGQTAHSPTTLGALRST